MVERGRGAFGDLARQQELLRDFLGGRYAVFDDVGSRPGQDLGKGTNATATASHAALDE
jgi:hypothetical protein